MAVKVERVTSVCDVDRAAWDGLVDRRSVGLETGHLAALERSAICGIRPYYIVVRDDDEVIGVCYCFAMDMDLASMSKELDAEEKRILKVWRPGFLEYRVVEVGFVASLGKGFAIAPGREASFLRALRPELEELARVEAADFILVRDVPRDELSRYAELERGGYRAFLGYPQATLAPRWQSFEQYLGSLKSLQRRNVKACLSALERGGVVVEVVQDYGRHAARLERLWQNVHERSKDYSHEILTRQYFERCAELLSGRSTVVCLRRGEELVASAFALAGDDEIAFLHAGLDYTHNQDCKLYFNLVLACLRCAIEGNYRRLNFGITNYPFKCKVGCELEPLMYLIKGRSRGETRAFSAMLSEGIEQPENSHRPFLGQTVEERKQLKELSLELDGQSGARPDVFQKAYEYSRIGKLKVAGIYSFFQPVAGSQEAVVDCDGRKIIMLGANSYLGLSSDERVKSAAIHAIEKYGTSCSGSPCLNGTLDLHEALRSELARFLRKEDVILLGTGYQTNIAAITGIVGRADAIVIDTLNHASLIDGARFSRAKILTYRNNDMGSLRSALERCPEMAKFVVVDAVFSMEGTVVDLPGIVAVAKQYGARIMIDEAHSIGVVGPGGRGVASLYGLEDDVDIIMGTFSKSLGAIGGFLAGEAEVMDYLRHASRPHIFSASLPPPVVAAVREALKIIQEEPERRARVLRNARSTAEELTALGYDAPYGGAAIVPVHCGGEIITLALFRKLFEEGVFVNPVLSPAVPKGEELLRTSYMATHDDEVLGRVVEVFRGIKTAGFPKGRAPRVRAL